MTLSDIPRLYVVITADQTITTRGKEDLMRIMEMMESQGKRYLVACG